MRIFKKDICSKDEDTTQVVLRISRKAPPDFSEYDRQSKERQRRWVELYYEVGAISTNLYSAYRETGNLECLKMSNEASKAFDIIIKHLKETGIITTEDLNA